MKKPVMLMILDGFGLSDHTDGNAVYSAKKPNFDSYWNKYPHTMIKASGLAVGLPEGQMGNSEVGHTNIGAGRVVYQELTRISEMIRQGSFFKNPALTLAMDEAVKNNADVHLLGLVSDGGVHSHIDHIKALIKLAAIKGVRQVYLHAFMDGRDTSPTAGVEYLKDLQETMKEEGIGKIATISGRYYAMDRDNRWDRVEKAYNTMVKGEGATADDPIKYMEKSYLNEITDEFIEPVVITGEDGLPLTRLKNNDSVIFFNFRPDRGREMTRAINDLDFVAFKRDPLKLNYITMTQYDKTLRNVTVAYMPQVLDNMLGAIVAKHGKKQLRIAETEKYAHVTFFFNGGVEIPYEGEDRILVPSPKVATYDLMPQMSAEGVTDRAVEAISRDYYDLIILNYANCDMVGHTGVFEAAVKAVETVDHCMKRVIDKVLEKGGSVLVTADHGNCEQLVDYATGEPFTSHTTNPVPLIYVTENPQKILGTGVLADLAPTLLEEMELPKPVEMTAASLFRKTNLNNSLDSNERK